MNKPQTADGYRPDVTENCERMLVTLLRKLGPWKDSLFLVGGLAPRYLVPERPDIPPHAGTMDVDVVVELKVLADTQAYQTLEANLKDMGFSRATNEEGIKLSWRWRVETETGATVILEFLADDPAATGGKVRPLPSKGRLSALNIPHAAMVFDHHETKDVTAKLLGGDGIVTETVRHADVVTLVCLKAFAFDDRAARKDAHDLVYCLQHADGGIEGAAEAFRDAHQGRHAHVIDKALEILKSRFVDDDRTEGYSKDGPIAAARFDWDDDGAPHDALIRRQREVSDLVTRFVAAAG